MMFSAKELHEVLLNTFTEDEITQNIIDIEISNPAKNVDEKVNNFTFKIT